MLFCKPTASERGERGEGERERGTGVGGRGNERGCTASLAAGGGGGGRAWPAIAAAGARPAGLQELQLAAKGPVFSSYDEAEAWVRGHPQMADAKLLDLVVRVQGCGREYFKAASFF